MMEGPRAAEGAVQGATMGAPLAGAGRGRA